MIVNSYSSTSASVCGRGGYVNILYTKYFSWSCLVNICIITEILHVFQRTQSQLYGVIPVGMLAN